jgi:hypothetical protein
VLYDAKLALGRDRQIEVKLKAIEAVNFDLSILHALRRLNDRFRQPYAAFLPHTCPLQSAVFLD